MAPKEAAETPGPSREGHGTGGPSSCAIPGARSPPQRRRFTDKLPALFGNILCFPFPAISQHFFPTLDQALIIYIWQRNPPHKSGTVVGSLQILREVFSAARSCSDPTETSHTSSPSVRFPASILTLLPHNHLGAPSGAGMECRPPRLSPYGHGAEVQPHREAPADCQPRSFPASSLLYGEATGGKAPPACPRAAWLRPTGRGPTPSKSGTAPVATHVLREEPPPTASRSSRGSGKDAVRCTPGGQSPRSTGERQEPSSDGKRKCFHFDYTPQIALV